MSTTTWTLDPAHTTAGFSVKHMMFATVRGRFGDVSGTITVDEDALDRSQVSVDIDAASIDTGVDKRDEHLRSSDFFDVETFPHLTFRSRRVEGARLEEGATFQVVGDLTIRDVTREVTLDVTYLGDGVDPWGGRRAGFEATTTIDRREWGLTWNQGLEKGGVLVGHDVTIELTVQAVREEVEAGVA